MNFRENKNDVCKNIKLECQKPLTIPKVCAVEISFLALADSRTKLSRCAGPVWTCI